MGHLPSLITDLALILGSAAIVIMIFKFLKQPVVLGYIIAGLLVGPNFHIFPTVIELEGIKIWAEIGVIFLLFGLGLEFSFKKLVKVGSIAAITALTGVSLTMLIGFSLGVMLGWSTMDCLFLGGILSIASTTIIFRAFDELGVKSQKFAGIVLGVLVIEDLVAVVLMVVLSTVAVSQTFQGIEMLYSVLKLAFFLVLWFVSGIFFIPSMFKLLKKYLNDETLLVISLALCFLMVVLSANAGFSPALGAFIMGSILAETPKVEKIEHLLTSVKDLFGAIFFVSVGMLLDVEMLWTYAVPIISATLVLLIGKPLFVTIGALISGQSIKTAVQTGMSLSQIGEFSFIIATLGVTLNVTSDFLYPIAVAVSVITTFTTPYMIQLSSKTAGLFEKNLPEKWKSKLNRYSQGAQQVKEVSDWKKFMRFYIWNVVLFSILSISIIIISSKFIQPLFDTHEWQSLISITITMLLISPFLYALGFRRSHSQAFANLWTKSIYRGPLIGLIIFRIALVIFFIGWVFDTYYSPMIAVIGVIVSTIILIALRKQLKRFYGRIEDRFLKNLHERERLANENTPILAPWDSHLAKFTIQAQSPIVGIPLIEMKLRENFGINVAIIERGEVIISIPTPKEILYPNDTISVIGTDEQLTAFKNYMIVQPEEKEPEETTSVGLHSFTVNEKSKLIGTSIRKSLIREQCKGILVGLEREGQRFVNPNPDILFEASDIVWIVGNNKRIHVFLREELSQ